jgi:hypothetical protein
MLQSGAMSSRIGIAGGVLTVILLAGCGRNSGTPKKPEESVIHGAPILRVAVFADGRLTVDGSPSTLAALHDSLLQLSAQHGVIWYYREAPQAEPPPIALQVMKELADSQLPLRLSSRADYSDSVTASPPPRPAK